MNFNVNKSNLEFKTNKAKVFFEQHLTNEITESYKNYLQNYLIQKNLLLSIQYFFKHKWVFSLYIIYAFLPIY